MRLYISIDNLQDLLTRLIWKMQVGPFLRLGCEQTEKKKGQIGTQALPSAAVWAALPADYPALGDKEKDVFSGSYRSVALGALGQIGYVPVLRGQTSPVQQGDIRRYRFLGIQKLQGLTGEIKYSAGLLGSDMGGLQEFDAIHGHSPSGHIQMQGGEAVDQGTLTQGQITSKTIGGDGQQDPA